MNPNMITRNDKYFDDIQTNVNTMKTITPRSSKQQFDNNNIPQAFHSRHGLDSLKSVGSNLHDPGSFQGTARHMKDAKLTSSLDYTSSHYNNVVRQLNNIK